MNMVDFQSVFKMESGGCKEVESDYERDVSVFSAEG